MGNELKDYTGHSESQSNIAQDAQGMANHEADVNSKQAAISAMGSGSKYIRSIHSCLDQGEGIKVDVYEVLEAFNVTCPAIQHALKKLLCTGIRGKGDKIQDLTEARDAIDRAIKLQCNRDGSKNPYDINPYAHLPGIQHGA